MIIPSNEVVPLWRIRLHITFMQPNNFCKELLTFEVVNFIGTYHALLGWSCFTKFLAAPNYAYHKLMMPISKGVITVISASFLQAFYCDRDCITQATVISTSCGSAISGSGAEEAQGGKKAKVTAPLQRPSSDEAPMLQVPLMFRLSPLSRCLYPQKELIQPFLPREGFDRAPGPVSRYPLHQHGTRGANTKLRSSASPAFCFVLLFYLKL